LQQIPSSVDRKPLYFNGFVSHWEIIDYPQYPDCIGCQVEITQNDQDKNMYGLHSRVVNSLNCTLQHDPTTNQWKASSVMSTLTAGPPEQMKIEQILTNLISKIQNLKVQDDSQLVIETNDGEQVRLESFTKAAPSPVTKNIFR
jgi:hypothetical protein